MYIIIDILHSSLFILRNDTFSGYPLCEEIQLVLQWFFSKLGMALVRPQSVEQGVSCILHRTT